MVVLLASLHSKTPRLWGMFVSFSSRVETSIVNVSRKEKHMFFMEFSDKKGHGKWKLDTGHGPRRTNVKINMSRRGDTRHKRLGQIAGIV